MYGRLLAAFAAVVAASVLGCGEGPTTGSTRPVKGDERDNPQSPDKKGASDKTNSPSSEPTAASELERAIVRAKTEGKLVFVEFSAEWCGPCQMMRRDTFNNPQVLARLADYVAVFVDTDRDPKVAQAFGVRGIPAYYLVQADRKVAKSGSGYLDAGAFMQWLGPVK